MQEDKKMKERGTEVAKINQEEYEVLKPKLEEEYTHVGKSRDGKLQFLQGYIERDMKREEWSDGWGQTYMRPVNLFQFIQWEDEEPYNIAELIEEYEYSALERHLKSFKELSKAIRTNESEEIEMNKNKMWAKIKIQEELESWREVEGGIDEEGVNYVLNIIDQLDEPELLTQEWVDKRVVHIRGLGDILKAEDVESLLVPKQAELEVKIQELIEAYKQEEDAYSNPENGWISGFIEDLKNLVEEEQKYYVDLDTAAYVAKWNGDDQVGIYTADIAGSDEFEFHLTEQEIKDYDPRYMVFAIPVEEGR